MKVNPSLASVGSATRGKKRNASIKERDVPQHERSSSSRIHSASNARALLLFRPITIHSSAPLIFSSPELSNTTRPS